MESLSPTKVINPSGLMKGLHEAGQKAIVDVVEIASAPESRKQLRDFNSNNIAALLGISLTRVRFIIKAIEEQQEIPFIKQKRQIGHRGW